MRLTAGIQDAVGQVLTAHEDAVQVALCSGREGRVAGRAAVMTGELEPRILLPVLLPRSCILRQAPLASLPAHADRRRTRAAVGDVAPEVVGLNLPQPRKPLRGRAGGQWVDSVQRQASRSGQRHSSRATVACCSGS